MTLNSPIIMDDYEAMDVLLKRVLLLAPSVDRLLRQRPICLTTAKFEALVQDIQKQMEGR